MGPRQELHPPLDQKRWALDPYVCVAGSGLLNGWSPTSRTQPPYRASSEDAPQGLSWISMGEDVHIDKVSD